MISDHYQALIARGTIRSDPGQHAVLPLLDEIAAGLAQPRRWFRKVAPQRGLYLWGEVGRGKSLLMDLLVAAVEGSKRQHFHAFLLELHAAVHAARSAGVRDAIGTVIDQAGQGLRLLALDEMDVSDIADAMLIDRLFRGLLSRGVAIVTTSNRPPSDLYRNGLKRELFLPFIELLERELTVQRIEGPHDWRRAVASGNKVQFLIGDPGFDQLWEDCTGGGETARDLQVLGRSLYLPRTYGRFLRTDFGALCVDALGTADHHQIAQSFDAVFLDGVPRITEIDPLRRFTTLIDELYEARRVLVIRSAVPIEQLIALPGMGARTVSRLVEMAGENWSLLPGRG